MFNSSGIDIFATCPPSSRFGYGTYAEHVAEIAGWADDAGCRGILVYTDNSLLDPWLVAQVILQNTTQLRPLVAVQPAYMHPYAAAKMTASLGHLYGRALDLNFVAGGFRNDLLALADSTEHDDRYTRLVEYATIVKALLRADGPVTFEGRYYTVRNLRLTPRLAPALFPGVMVSGSSDAGRRAAQMIGATAVKYPRPVGEEKSADGGEPTSNGGIRIGIIARERAEDAWRLAHERFPTDRKGQITHAVAMRTTDSRWHQQLSEMGDHPAADDDPYWLHPFQNYQTFCPYLVGSYARVAEEVGRYLRAGVSTMILDVPASREELDHIGIVLAESRRAAEHA
jgi:alkanesulfonate monooxygenase